MKCTACLALAILCAASAARAQEAGLHKRVSVDYRDVPLAEVIQDLSSQTGVRIDAPGALLQNQERLTFSASDLEAGRILAQILRPRGLAVQAGAGGTAALAALPELDEFRVKREAVYEFARKPAIERDGDRFTITFETKALCDVTVAIEDTEGNILRHLACGVLGEHAPEPFQWNSRKQALVWDGKNDKGAYVDDLNAARVRVSLGLKAAYEKALFESPHKRIGSYAPNICATPEGVYVGEGNTVDTVRLFDHDGNYVRMVYPFPTAKLEGVQGLETQKLPQADQVLPRKLGSQQATLLTSGTGCQVSQANTFGGGFSATCMAVHGERLALAFLHLNRLKTDGTTGGLPLKGPATGFVVKKGTLPYQQGDLAVGPSSAAFSPDGRTLYLTGYLLFNWSGYSRHGVYKIDFEKGTEAELFAGNMAPDGFGSDNAHFAVPNAVACDAQGRVYVADYMNKRVQVLDAAGKFLKTLDTPYPAKVQIDPRTQEIYVFSWNIGAGIGKGLADKYGLDIETLRKIPPSITRFGTFDDPKKLAQWKLPVEEVSMGFQQSWMGQVLHAEIDFHAKQPTLWLAGRKFQINTAQIGHLGSNVFKNAGSDDAVTSGIVLLALNGNAWKPKLSFGQAAKKEATRIKPPDFGIQRLYVNPKNHKAYVLEHLSFNKSHHTLIELDPESGKVNEVPMPFRAEDICFDPDGHVYLRTDHEVVRYDARTWREVAWDYGEERERVTFDNDPAASVLSALAIPGERPVFYHEGGMWVSAKGHLAVACVNRPEGAKGQEDHFQRGPAPAGKAKAYAPKMYPGRARYQEIHIWDKYGKLIAEDAVPGLGICNGVAIDRDDSLYVMAQGTRRLGGKPYPNASTGTLMKFRARKNWGDIVLRSPDTRISLPLPKEQHPKRPPDIDDTFWSAQAGGGPLWVDRAEWFYGGVGITGGACCCYHTRFSFDGFARSYAPEPDLYSVAILDGNGNLILRVGRYGNADDGLPAGAKPEPAHRNPLGGDEVALFYPAYVAADTDRRLFVADIGNARIVSVKLDYHATETLPLEAGPASQK